MRGNCSGLNRTKISLPHIARSRPIPPAIRASTKLSVRSCLIRRFLPAPSAARIAISRVRAVARASSRFATFTQAISKTNPTAIIMTKSAGRIVRVIRSCSATTCAPQYLSVSGYCLASEVVITSRAAWACGTVTRGLSRAMLRRKWAPRCSPKEGTPSDDSNKGAIVVHRVDVWRWSGYRKLAGMTPTTV